MQGDVQCANLLTVESMAPGAKLPVRLKRTVSVGFVKEENPAS